MDVPELLARILAALEGGHEDPIPPADLEVLLVEVFAYQAARIPAYREHCLSMGRPPERVERWQDIPPVPVRAFQHIRWATFPEVATVRVFQTSGTTAGRPGRHSFETLALYDAAALSNWRRHLLPDAERIQLASLTPPPEAARASSLVYMLEKVRERFGTPESAFYVEEAAICVDRFLADMQAAQGAARPVCVAAPAFALLALVDALEARGTRIELPPQSRVMDTGGFKGRTREVTSLELHEKVLDRLGIPSLFSVNEYGMTELSSQFYDTVLHAMHAGTPAIRAKDVPPWTRIVVVDPGTGTPLLPGEEGALRIFDLANLGSAVCIQTEDTGFALPDGRFEVLGRLPESEARGCSLLFEDIEG